MKIVSAHEWKFLYFMSNETIFLHMFGSLLIIGIRAAMKNQRVFWGIPERNYNSALGIKEKWGEKIVKKESISKCSSMFNIYLKLFAVSIST